MIIRFSATFFDDAPTRVSGLRRHRARAADILTLYEVNNRGHADIC